MGDSVAMALASSDGKPMMLWCGNTVVAGGNTATGEITAPVMQVVLQSAMLLLGWLGKSSPGHFKSLFPLLGSQEIFHVPCCGW